jgi:hypothetical protein
MNDLQALADAETYLANVLESSDLPRDASRYSITEAAQDYRETTGTWDLGSAEPQVIEDLLARHAK